MFNYANELATLISVIVFCIIAYLLGSISFAVIFTKVFSHTDVREHGSGNAGMTNVMRTSGKLPGVLTFLGDFLKGTCSVLSAKYLYVYLSDFLYNCGVKNFTLSGFVPTPDNIINPDIVAFIVAIFCLIGHMFPVFFGFRGGKGVATIVGAAMGFSPWVGLICFAFFIVLTLITKIVSLSSIFAVTLAVPLAYVFFDKTGNYIWFGSHQAVAATCFMAVMSIMVILKHRTNIKRLINGTENKIGSKKKG